MRGGQQEMLEGEQVSTRTVVLKFPSVTVAKEWYNSAEYTVVKAIRVASTAKTGRVTLVEGFA